MKKNILINFIAAVILLSSAVFFILKFAGPRFLKSYIETGIGNCESIPILCMEPSEGTVNPPVKESCFIRLIQSRDLPKISVCIPKGFTVVEERITKVYYKRSKRPIYDSVVYLLYEKPGFFIGLFPQLKRQGVNSDYEFIRRTMFARLNDIKNLTDAFFVIMKGVFIPDLGNQRQATMAQFSVGDKYGFINYNLEKSRNSFDCNIFNKEGEFFKVYIKDKGATLDLDTVFAIISSLKKAKN